MQTKLSLDSVTFKRNSELVFEDFSWEIKQGQHWVITGSSGSGKSTLLQALRGDFLLQRGNIRHHYGPCEEQGLKALEPYAAFVSFQDKEINYNNFYYQQRYNSSDVEDTFTLRQFLGSQTAQDGNSYIINLLQLSGLLDKEFIKLSNGETRKAFLAKAMLKQPKLLVLDNPYTGLDADAREMINEMLDTFMECGVQVIMVGDSMPLPKKITHELALENYNARYISTRNKDPKLPLSPKYRPTISFGTPIGDGFDIAVKLSDVVIAYNENTILDHLNWTIKKNEKWALTGNNGAGKSMLISLIFADNPQAYANEIILFDHLRGQGESIWDIKEKIGFLSPELHFYTEKHQNCRETALNGLFSHPFKKITITEQHLQQLNFLFRYFNIAHLLDKPLGVLSTGQQRLVLFIGILIKNPSLLLLDEPFQGFDHEMVEKAKVLLDDYCKNKTLVFVSHRQEEIPSCINRFARLENGKLL